MSILVDVIFTCDGCMDVAIVEHDGLRVGERPPSISLPNLWNGVDTGRTLCPRCCEEPVPQLEKPPAACRTCGQPEEKHHGYGPGPGITYFCDEGEAATFERVWTPPGDEAA